VITLKEFLAEPQTMYDGGVVQHMSEGGMPLTIVEVSDKPEGIRYLLNDTKFGRSASDPAYITPNQKTMRTYDKKPVSLSLEQLKDIPGASGEERFRADPEAFGGVGKYGPLRESIKRKGYQDYEGNPLTTDPITLEVNSKGEAVIAEGNHRLAEAIESGRDSIPVHIQYYGGSENIEGPYNPDRLQLGPRVLKEGEKGAIRLSPEKFQSLTEQLPEVEQQLSITEQQLPVTKKSTLPVPKSIKEKLLRNIRNFIPLIKAGRSLSPVGIALNLLQIIPEETMNNAVDYLKNTPTHELFGLEKSGLESVEDLWEEVKGHLITQTEPTEITAQYIRNLDLYHGTSVPKLIGGKFKASKVGVLGQGVYATPDTEYAAGRAEEEGGNIHPVKANIENPLIVRIKGRFHHYTPARVFEELGVSKEKAFEMAERNSEEHGGDFTTQFKSRARKQGYDSIVLVNDETNTMQEIVVFDPDKVVSKFKPMYDGGLVQHMSEGGEPKSNLPVSTEEESLVGDIVKVGKKVGRKAVDIATKRVPGVGLISSSPAGEGSTIYTPEETRKLLKTKQGTELNKLKNKVRKLIKHGTKELVNPLSTTSDIFNLTRTGKSGKINKNSIKFLRNMSTEELFKGMTETGNEDPGPFFSKMQEVYDANWQEIREYLGESPETIEEYKKEYDVDSPSERNTQRELAEEKGYTKPLTHVTLSPEISNDILRVIPEVNNKNPLLTHDIGIHMTEQTETPNVFDAFKRRSSTPKDPLIREYLEVDSKEPDLDSDEYTDWLDKIESLKSRINHEHKPDYFMTSEELDHYVDQYRSNFKNLDFPEGVNVIPLYAKLDRYISVPDMGVFKKPENWIRKMSYTPDTGEFFNDVLLEEVLSAAEEAGAEYDDPSGYIAMEEYAANQETQYPESVIELYPDYPDYDEKIYMNRKSMPDIHIEGESVIPFETKVKLWRHITSGALRFRDMVRGTERDKAWVEFLRNTLDKMGADAYGYINDIEGGGEVSYMFLHPEKSKSLFSEGFDPTKPEIGKYRGGQIRPMYDGGLVLA
jgi:hypothetical protein